MMSQFTSSISEAAVSLEADQPISTTTMCNLKN